MKGYSIQKLFYSLIQYPTFSQNKSFPDIYSTAKLNPLPIFFLQHEIEKMDFWPYIDINDNF